MLEFKEIGLSDREEIEKYTAQSDYRSCEYGFANLFIWRGTYHTEYALADGCLFIRFHEDAGEALLFPAGNGDKKRAVRAICETQGDGAVFSANEEQKEFLMREFPGEFSFTPVRDAQEYLYNASDLIDLSGGRYHAKRNHIAHFEQKTEGEALYRRITQADIPACKAAYENWARMHGGGEESEQTAVYEALEHFSALGLSGGLIGMGDEICAFSVGYRLNSDTYDVLIEKAMSGYEEAYAVINQRFAADFCSGFRYINREEDMGIDGLRKAKLSYHPALLPEKYLVRRCR